MNAPLPFPTPIVLQPDVSRIVTEDDVPVDNFPSEKQQRLLVETLYTAWGGPPPLEDMAERSFVAAANVGLYSMVKGDPLVPDVFVSLDVKLNEDIWAKENRTYFFWEMGKPPDVVIEVVSSREGEELDRKMKGYARMRIPYYVVYDPQHLLGPTALQVWKLTTLYYQMIEPRFEMLDLGLVEWKGKFEDLAGTWLRWCKRDGSLLLTGSELALTERKRANSERERADTEKERADTEKERADRLAEKLRALGIDPTSL